MPSPLMVEMFKVEGILRVVAVECCEIKDVFSQGRISYRNDKTFTFHASDRIDGRSFLQCLFVHHQNVWTDFHFAQFEIHFG